MSQGEAKKYTIVFDRVGPGKIYFMGQRPVNGRDPSGFNGCAELNCGWDWFCDELDFRALDRIKPIEFSTTPLNACNVVVATVGPETPAKVLKWTISPKDGLDIDVDESPGRTPASTHRCVIRIKDEKLVKAKSLTVTVEAELCNDPTYPTPDPNDPDEDDLCSCSSTRELPVDVEGLCTDATKCSAGTGNSGGPKGGCSGGSCDKKTGIGTGVVANQSLDVMISLGANQRGESVGVLYMSHAVPTANLVSANSLKVSGTPEVTATEFTSGTPSVFKRQIRAPQGLAQVVASDPALGSFAVEFYTDEAAGSPDALGRYTPQGDPFRTWQFQAAANLIMRVRDGGSPEVIHDFAYSDQAPRGWTLTEKTAGEVVIRTISRTDDAATNRLETYEVKNATGTPTYRVQTQYQQFSWGEGILQQNVLTGATTSPLTTDYTYNSSGQITSFKHPDGSWVIYNYSDGVTTSEVHSWADVTLQEATSTPNLARVIEYDYTIPAGSPELTYTSSGFPRPRAVTEKVKGHIVSRTYYAYYVDTGERVEEEVRDTDPGAGDGYADADNLRTITRYYSDTATGPQAGQIHSVVYPDGRMDVYEYASGQYTPGDSQPGTFSGTGTDLCVIVIHGASQGGAFVAVVGKTTRQTTISDNGGKVFLTATEAYDGSYGQISWVVRDYDTQGHRLHTYYSNGTHEDAQWGSCCQETSETDVTGVTTTFDARDYLGRLTQKTRVALSVAGNYPEQPAAVTTYSYDVSGRLLTESVSSGTLTSGTSTQYDWAGRVRFSTDASGLTAETRYETSSGGDRRIRIIRPGGDEEITDYYRDGRVKQVSGSAVVQRTYTYDVNTDGTLWETVYTGPAGTGSPMWVKITTDHLGRTKLEEKPAYGTGTVTTTSEYWTDSNLTANGTWHRSGALKRVTKTGVAPTVYEYDQMAGIIRSGPDLAPVATPDPLLAPDSLDRIQRSDTYYEHVDGAWWRVATNSTYDQDNNDTVLPVSTRREKLSGLATGEIEYSEAADAHGNVTITSTILGANQIVSRTVTPPAAESNTPEITVTRNSLVQSSRSRTGLTTIYGYDALGRQTTVTDAQGHTTTTGYYPTVQPRSGQVCLPGQVARVTDAAGYFTSYGYDTATGRLKSTINAGEQAQYFSYTTRGEQEKTWGSATYPTWMEYDAFGRRWKLHTYRSGTGFDSDTWPSVGDGDVTTWNYDGATGLLTSKQYADTTSVGYTYTADGKLHTRTWARTVGTPAAPLVTTYGYSSTTGEMTGITYSDNTTPNVTYTYDRLGRQRTVTDAVGSRTFAYNGLDLHSESITGQLYSRVITRSYAQSGAVGRSTGFFVGPTDLLDDAEYIAGYGYDDQGRLNNVTGPGLPTGGATYERFKNGGAAVVSERMGTIAFGTAPAARATFGYTDARGLVTSVQNDAGNPLATVSKYQYRNDALGRRRDVVYTGAAFDQDHMFKWGYNTRSELETADRHEGTTPDNPGDLMMLGDYDYRYDHIGNRTSYRLDVDPATTYSPNNVNQYLATANPTENFCYDADGNLIQDGKSVANCSEVEGMFSYYWDAENRLIRVERTTPDLPTDKRVVCTYDHLGRRVRKVVYGVDPRTFAWLSEPESDLRFVYDGWNVVEVLDGLASNQVVKKYTWGLDLSGQAGNSTTAGIHGAGGIGGLLAVEEPQTVGDPKRYWFFYDANGNVGQVIQNTTGYPVVAHYEYDPYGNTIVATGTYAAANPIRFSTKWLDPETELYYYGYRYYSPRLGRWMSRDPIGERGGLSLYAALKNRPSVLRDALGEATNGDDCPTAVARALLDPEIRGLYDRAINGKDAIGLPCLTGIKCICCLWPGIAGGYNPISREILICQNRLSADEIQGVLNHELIHASTTCGWWKLGCQNCMTEEKSAYYWSGGCFTDEDCSRQAWGSCRASLSCSGGDDGWKAYLGVGWPPASPADRRTGSNNAARGEAGQSCNSSCGCGSRSSCGGGV